MCPSPSFSWSSIELSRAFERYLPGEEGGGRQQPWSYRGNKNNIGQDYTEVVMHVVMGNLKLGEIKGCDRSKGKGYSVKGAHNEGNGKSYFFYF